mmetsp:Transcript_19885/g.30623  ORF Transcript_19885/g.30623 Transcript_19885/m.30623 type:complete len:105 (+) Transcript_19885:678-992(+)
MLIFRNVLRINNFARYHDEFEDEIEDEKELAKINNGFNNSVAQGPGLKSVRDRVVTPYDLEMSILRPQHDPLVGELITRLLQKNKWKQKDTHVDRRDEEEYQPT